MSRLSVISSNSLRRSSPSSKKRAQSLGQLGELREEESYEYNTSPGPGTSKTGSSLYWQGCIQQAHSNRGGALQRTKSSCQVSVLPEATPTVARTAAGHDREVQDQQRPGSCHTGIQTARRHHLPDLLSSSCQPDQPKANNTVTLK